MIVVSTGLRNRSRQMIKAFRDLNWDEIREVQMYLNNLEKMINLYQR